MNKFLPKTKNNPLGFTLVELLVVISILAILGVVGITIFSGTQKTARDAKRKADIDAMSAAMETNYVYNTGYQTTVLSTWFSDQVLPANPKPPDTPYSLGTPTTSLYTFCATLENATGNATSIAGAGMGTTTGGFYCKKNQQ